MTMPSFPQPPMYPLPQPKKSHGCLYAFLGVTGGAVLLIVIIVVAVAASSGGSGSSGGSSASSSSPAAAPVASSAAPKLSRIGTPARDGKFEFTITSVSHEKSVGDTADGLGDTAQGEYTILHVTVTNIGKESQSLFDSNQYVFDASGRKYSASNNADVDLSDNSGGAWYQDINPGNTVHGEIAFDMPDGVKAVKAELHDSAFSGGVDVSLR